MRLQIDRHASNYKLEKDEEAKYVMLEYVLSLITVFYS